VDPSCSWSTKSCIGTPPKCTTQQRACSSGHQWRSVMDRPFTIQNVSRAECPSVNRATELSMWFAGGSQIELIRTQFRSPLIHEEICAVRGKTAGAYSTGVTFQWTSAVQALSVLLLKAAARGRLNKDLNHPLLEGGKGSMASSLDASIYKQKAKFPLLTNTTPK
jgi:hypothetical protein